MSLSGLIAIAWLLLSLVPLVRTAGAATDEEGNFLALYFSNEELEVLSATRSLKSVANVAENVVVVTAEEIEVMNAHTVAEALYNVTGIEMVDFTGPGSEGGASIHGSGRDRVTVMLDGVPLTSANNTFKLAALPVQMIRKIEVIKGPASSTWGSSFGGVVNVITKAAGSGERLGGALSASVGERDTSDVRAEFNAGSDRFGIYVYGGRMDSDGLRGGHEFTHENFFGKVNFDAGAKSRIDLTGYYHRSDSVNANYLVVGRDAYDGFALETLFGKADLRTSFAAGVDLSLSAWRLRNNDNFYENRLSTGVRTRDAPIQYDRHGFSGSLAWRTECHALVAGADSSNDSFEREIGAPDTIDLRKYALFVNDTFSAGGLAVTPGVRYDHSSLAGELASPSLGATYLASRDLLFRALVSRGFHEPAIVRYFDAPLLGYYAPRELRPEKIWSYQAGTEANVADLLRAKLTLFYHDIDGILIERPLGPGTFTMENGGRATTAGGEFEIATNAYEGFVFKSGVHYEQTRLIGFSVPLYADVRDVYGVNATLAYDGKKGLRGTVKAHYLRWDMAESWMAEAGGVVVDGTLAKELSNTGATRLDLFAGVHNIFDARSYNDHLHQNPGRWLEAGVRCAF